VIVTRTPFRISLMGGGTDLRAFYSQHTGSVLSTAVDKYMYLIVKGRFDGTIRVSYSRTEIVDKVDDIQHPIVQEAMRLTGVTEGVEIVSVADVPAGTGLGSSSSFTVGLLNALFAYKGILRAPDELAEMACRIEIDILGEPIGKQDQYIAAFGGVCQFQFLPGEQVDVDCLPLQPEVVASLNRRLLLLYMGKPRAASSILHAQDASTGCNTEILCRMRDLVPELRRVLMEGRNLDAVGELLDQGWNLKKRLASGISDTEIDRWYETARRRGALGGKVLGAGGGGFLLLYCPEQHRQRVLDGLSGLRPVAFQLGASGSRISYVERGAV